MQMAPRQLSVRLSVILAAIVSVFLLIGGPADADAPPPPTEEYVVISGDSLWSIAAERIEAGDDIRVLIADIRTASGLNSSSLHPGQILRIPQG